MILTVLAHDQHVVGQDEPGIGPVLDQPLGIECRAVLHLVDLEQRGIRVLAGELEQGAADLRLLGADDGRLVLRDYIGQDVLNATGRAGPALLLAAGIEALAAARQGVVEAFALERDVVLVSRLPPPDRRSRLQPGRHQQLPAGQRDVVHPSADVLQRRQRAGRPGFLDDGGGLVVRHA